MTITTTPSAEALDLRPLLDLRAESDRITAELRAGDLTGADRARELLAIETSALHDFKDAMREHAYAPEVDGVGDAASELFSALGTGDLGFALDQAEGRA